MAGIENFIKMSDGAKIYFEDTGSGKPLVLLPGYLATTKFFKKNVPELSKKYRVVTLDPRGQGNSSKQLSGNTIERTAEDVKEVIDALGLFEVSLFGWSMAGSIVTTYAKNFENHRLSAVGLIDTPLFPFSPEEWNKNPGRGFNVSAYMKSYGALYYNYEATLLNSPRRLFGREPSPEDAAWIIEEQRKTYPFTALSMHYDYATSDCLSLVPEIAVPVIIYAADTPFYGLSMSREIQKRVQGPCEYHEFLTGGHILQYSEAEKFNKITLEFLEKVYK